MQEMTFPSIAQRIPTEYAAYEFMEQLRWNGKVVCPHCGSLGDHRYLEPANGVSRETSRGTQSQRRVWKCRDCTKQFSVMTGTVMHGSHIPLRTWVLVFFEMCANKNGLAAREVERKYGLAPKSAWFMTQRIREAMQRDPLAGLLSGAVVVDETYIGGAPKNRHGNAGKSKRGRGTDKTPVVSLIDANTGEVRSRVVATVSGKTLRSAIAANVDMATTTLHTDSLSSYTPIGADMAGHFAVDHSKGQYVTEKSNGTNKAENYFSQLKRSIDGTHHHVSPEHLDRYLAEFDFRHSTHEITDTERMVRLAGQVGGKRLTYRPLHDDEL